MFKIICNNVPRQLIYGYELPEKIKKDFDYLEDIDLHNFFKYKGQYYCFDDFMSTHGFCGIDELKKLGFDGYTSDSYFSGVVVKILDDSDYVIAGTWIN